MGSVIFNFVIFTSNSNPAIRKNIELPSFMKIFLQSQLSIKILINDSVIFVSWVNSNESSRSGMAVLDVAIPTGYIIQQQVLDRYIRSRQVRNLQRARFLDRKVLFYFDYLDEEETCVNFTIERWHPVANMSRYLPIRVYDYYAPGEFFSSGNFFNTIIIIKKKISLIHFFHIFNRTIQRDNI